MKKPWRILLDILVRLGRIVRASFSQERMTYIAEESKVHYQSKDGIEEKTFDALEWLAAMCSHVPNKEEQMVRGFYSNVSRGKRKKQDQDGLKDSSGVAEPVLDYSDSQVQPSDDYLYCDEIYPVEDPDFSLVFLILKKVNGGKRNGAPKFRGFSAY